MRLEHKGQVFGSFSRFVHHICGLFIQAQKHIKQFRRIVFGNLICRIRIFHLIGKTIFLKRPRIFRGIMNKCHRMIFDTLGDRDRAGRGRNKLVSARHFKHDYSPRYFKISCKIGRNSLQICKASWASA